MSAVGRRIDRYEVEAELDSGGFGTVYRARHTVIGRTVALKLLHPSRSDSLAIVERFLREARIVAALSSPHVVQVLDAGMTEDRQLFLAMELLEGTTLATRLARGGPLPVRDAVAIARQILAGLAAAHAAGVVHRDLKPANVFLARTSGVPSMVPAQHEIAKVLDFGISKSRGRGDESVITMTGAVLGTPHYMAPEQLHGARDVDARADLYALAVVLYEMLSGRLPYEAQTLEELISKRLSDPPTLLGSVAPHVPREVLEVVERGLARDPDARFRSAQEFDQALARLESVALPPTTPAGRIVVSPSGRPPGPGASASMVLGATYATPSSARPPGSSTGPVSSGAVMVRSPVSQRPASAGATTDASLPPGTTRFPTRGISIGLLVMLLAGAGLVIVVLIAALASVTTAWWMTREPSAPAAGAGSPGSGAPSGGVTPTPAPSPGPLPPGPVPEWDPFGVGAVGGLEPPAAVAPGAGAPASHEGPLRTRLDHVLGRADPRAFDELLERARPSIDRCRRSVGDDVRVQVFLDPGGAIPMAQPDPNAPHGDDETARCVARAIQGAAPLSDRDARGIAIVLSHLPAR